MRTLPCVAAALTGADTPAGLRLATFRGRVVPSPMADNDLTSVDLPRAKLQLTGPNGARVEKELGFDTLRIGSAPECEMVSEDPHVSPLHCEVVAGTAGWIIKDLGSERGLLLGGVRIFEAQLTAGAEFRLGSSSLQILQRSGTTTVPLSNSNRFGAALGSSVAMRALFAKLERAAMGDAPVVLLGESGTGKGLLAEAIHAASPRRDGPFVVFDCASVSPTLLESELFGYAKGAYTGATASRMGLLEEANGGTLFIDEIGELPTELQPRLLRALEKKEVRPLGSNDIRSADVRIIAATHRDLRARVASGAFREDLYYRLAVVEAPVPSLRERKDDIPLLVEAILAAQQPARALSELPPHAMALLKSHSWPGNVRELRNTVFRLMLFPHLGTRAMGLSSTPNGPSLAAYPSHLPLREARDVVLADFERQYLVEKLRESGGNVSAAARAMGVSRQFTHRLMSRYDIRGGDQLP